MASTCQALRMGLEPMESTKAGRPFRSWCPEASLRRRQPGEAGQVSKGNRKLKAEGTWRWCRAKGRLGTEKLHPRVSPQQLTGPIRNLGFLLCALGGLGKPSPLQLERNSEAVRGTEIPMWDSSSCVAVAALRAGTWFPTCHGPRHGCTHSRRRTTTPKARQVPGTPRTS